MSNIDQGTTLLTLLGNKISDKISNMSKLIESDDVSNIGYPFVDNLTELSYDILVNNQTVPTDLLSNALQKSVSKIAEWTKTPLKDSKFEDTIKNTKTPVKTTGRVDDSAQILKKAFESSSGVNKRSTRIDKTSNKSSWDLSNFLTVERSNHDNSVTNSTTVNSSIGDSNIINSIVNSFNSYGKYNPNSFTKVEALGSSLQFNPQLITFGGNKYE